jgi:cytochrome c biogenesis protein CcmG, thiol:disulfide interchange protein DsbE
MKIVLALLLMVSAPALADTDPLASGEYKGKVVYLDFWASWCGPCKESFPWLNEIHAKYKDKGFVVIGINLDKDKAKADEFLKSHAAQFPIVYNTEGDLAKKYGVKGMPYSIILDKGGKVLHSHIGFHKDKTKEYTDIIEGALK